MRLADVLVPVVVEGDRTLVVPEDAFCCRAHFTYYCGLVIWYDRLECWAKEWRN